MMLKLSRRLSLLALAALVAVPLAAPLQAEEEARIGRKIDNFSLRDFRGKQHDLADYDDSEIIVVAFLGTECPLAKLYAPRLADMAEKFADEGVTFLGINSNLQDPPTKIGAYARIHKIEFPILKDPDNHIADVFAAIRTPEVFVLDADRVVRYWGRIDDQYGFASGTGYGKPKFTRSDLGEAIEELLAGKQVSVPVTVAPGCHIGRVPSVEPHGDVTYSNQIARVFKARCVECHREGEIGPFPLTNYDEVVGWGEMIREVVEQKRMPPWFANPEHGTFLNDPRLTDEEKEMLNQWVSNGMPEGDPAQLPEPAQYVSGWSIPDPDVVYQMRDEPYTVQAEGTVDYQYFTVDPGFTEDKWIKAAEARPGNRAVVHHIIVFISDADGEGGIGRGNGALIGYAPGSQSRVYPEGVGIRVPAGSKLTFQMHYTAIGTEQQDLSSVGVIFADPDEITHELQGGAIGNVSFRIPPGESDHVVKARYKCRRDIKITSMFPHMHVRGVAFNYVAHYPDGTQEVLLDVPQYDFNWQIWYDLPEPKVIPKGSWVHCTARFDNSEGNIFNPDPTDEVTFGEQTWEEMMFGFYSKIVPRTDLAKK